MIFGLPSCIMTTPAIVLVQTPEMKMSDLFPVFLKLNKRRVLIVGGGKMAARRVQQLVRAGAVVTVVAPKICTEIEELAKAGSVNLIRRAFERADLSSRYFIVIAATNKPTVQKGVFQEAKRCRILCNIVDNPRYCNFYTPAVVKRGDLKIAVNTSGRSPSLAGIVRQYLEEAIPENVADLTTTVGILRSRLKSDIPGDLKRQKKLVREFVEKALKR